ncbi:hypothetical protein [Hyphomicrobium sp.]|jgi:hypothetical protein|uniref:hypothetical protein n=1 Tax=Hyphomicrobium sp. TaxID=82 RepID=UPI003568BAFB
MTNQPNTLLRTFEATKADRFVRIYDKTKWKMNGFAVFPAEFIESKSPTELAEIFPQLDGSNLYSCDVVVYPGDQIQEYAHANLPLKFFWLLNHYVTFVNERKLSPLTPAEAAALEAYKPVFDKIVAQVAEDQAAIAAPHDGSKEKYFSQFGFAPVPTSSEDRKALADEIARHIFNTDDPDNLHEAIFMLFDPASDRFDDSWMHAIASVYDREAGTLFKPEIPNQLYTYSAFEHEGWLGACAALYMGRRYLSGDARPVNPEIAAKWLEIAVSKGHPAAKELLWHIHSRDERYGTSGEEAFTAEINELLANEKAPPVLHQYTINLLARGANPEAQQEAMANFQYTAEGYSPYKLTSMWHLAVRAMLGIGTPQDLEPLRRYLTLLPDVDAATSGTSTELANTKKELTDILNAASTPALADAYKSAAAAICQWYTQDSNELLHSLKKKTPVSEQRPLRDILWLASNLASAEGWDIGDAVSRSIGQLRLDQAGISVKELEYSALLMGPRYNGIGSNGLPLLGPLEEPSPTLDHAMKQMAETGSYVPAPGVGIYLGLETTPDGQIRFNCAHSGNRPALLSAEDFDIAMILAFADEKRIIWPSLSMEETGMELTDGHEVFRYKEFSPAWMGNTDFGRTMYITDVLAGALAWNAHKFPRALAENPDHVRHIDAISSFLQDLVWTGGRHAKSTSKRVMMRTEHVQVDGQAPRIENGTKLWNINVQAVKMRVDGSYILKRTSGEENLLVALNDATYAHGARVQKITDNYDYIAGIMPIFERARQMMGLFYSLTELRKAGFQPHPTLRDELRKKLQLYADLPKLPRNQLWAQPFPHPPR